MQNICLKISNQILIGATILIFQCWIVLIWIVHTLNFLRSFCYSILSSMPPTYFPLRWESTCDQWWYASPIDWAAANGHYDLVREILRIDNNHLFKLTSLRRIRRLEIVWDDEEQFNDVAKFRSQVARKLFLECESSKKGKNSLIRAGYGGWLMYTAASAGDLEFVQSLLERNPLLVFGEGEYGVTDVLYAAARSKNCEVFRLLFDFAISPRLLSTKEGVLEEHIGEIPSVYKWEMTNRAVHAAARGGNLKILEELLANCSDVLAYRDAQGSTVLHAAAGRGQVEVVKYLASSFDIISSTDHQGNTALHVAAHGGQLAAVEALISAFPPLISLKNNAGETFLHKVVSGFHTPAFRRLDRQVELLKKLLNGNNFHIEEIINAKNNDGRTALHMAIIGNIHSDLVQLLMTAPSINVNVYDADGMTSLDYLKQHPNTASSDILIRKLISAGGMFGCEGDNARKAIASHLKMQGTSSSPGTSFRISDTEIFMYTGLENNMSDAKADPRSAGRMSSSSSEHYPYDCNKENRSSISSRRPSSVNYAAARLKRALHWPRGKGRKADQGFKKSIDWSSVESCRKWNTNIEETPTPLRQKFSRPLTLPNNKRTLSVRSHQSSPNAKKRFASGMVHGVIQSVPLVKVSGRSRSSSFSKSSISSPRSLDKQKAIYIDNDIAGPSCSNVVLDDESPNLTKRSSVSRRLKGHYFCFGGHGLNVKTPVNRHHENQSYKNPAVAVA